MSKLIIVLLSMWAMLTIFKAPSQVYSTAGRTSSVDNDAVGKDENEKSLAQNNFASTAAGYPRFTKKNPAKLIAKPAGSTLVLKCTAIGNPTPNITWYKDNRTPPERSFGSIKQEKWTLEMEECTTSDQGNYTCVVCNIYGCIQESFKVLISDSPRSKPLITKLGNVTVQVNGVANFSCLPIRTPQISSYFVWTKPKPNIPPKSCDTVDKLPPETILQNNSILTTPPEIYTIRNVTHEHEGWYTCFAANQLGVSCASSYLTVLDGDLIHPVQKTNKAQNMIQQPN